MTQKKPLAVGDRVRIFQSQREWTGVVEKTGGHISATSPKCLVLIRPDERYGQGWFGWYQPKQVRRLVKPERREFWVSVEKRTGSPINVFAQDVELNEFYEKVHVVEVSK